ncbi:MAG: amidophosphoribosyltransferase [Micavibrio sp.]|nr:amidophosphoribosyltransferase [Micavibrio sp.]|tara:strand:+ start:3797 stop:5257 length:1461 start_codon:yes stop_codon:yes gene_type:complete
MAFSDGDKFHDECGVFGIYGHDDAAAMTALGLHALQHRGQEACGIVTYDGESFYSRKALGLVDDTFSQSEVIESLKGYVAIGHNRYATTGDGAIRNVQPMYGDIAIGGFTVAHNGNLTNAHMLRRELVESGAIFQSTSDTEVIVHLVARSQQSDVVDRMTDALMRIEGGYALVASAQDKLIGVRDPHGIRPLCLGKLGNTYVLASESCAFDIIGADFVRNVEAGEMIIITKKGLESRFPAKRTKSRFCVFEYVYFARPDTFMEGQSVYQIRKNIGAELAKESPVPHADVIIPVPDSGVPSAIGYAEASGVPFELGIIRNHYVGRTFIEPTDKIRHLGVRLKHNANRAFIEDKIVVLVDDSIVRGTTSRKIVEMVRSAGAKEVHMRISSPPTSHSCFYGIDTPSTEELLAHKMSVEEICDHIKADSLAYVSIDGLYRASGEERRNIDQPQFCDACFTGDYPVMLRDHENNWTGVKVTNLQERQSKSS